MVHMSGGRLCLRYIIFGDKPNKYQSLFSQSRPYGANRYEIYIINVLTQHFIISHVLLSLCVCLIALACWNLLLCGTLFYLQNSLLSLPIMRQFGWYHCPFLTRLCCLPNAHGGSKNIWISSLWSKTYDMQP
jgi:hypothetical protein